MQTALNQSDDATLEFLMSVTDPESLAKWLSSEGADSPGVWKNVGDSVSNAGAIEASADEISPLVERVINGMEAVVEYDLAVQKLTREVPEPQSLREALADVVGIEGGSARTIGEIHPEVAQRVELVLEGSTKMPVILIRDRGIGVHPSEFENSLVSVHQSVKGDKPYLIGMYGQGGSSSFERAQYTILISRKSPNLLVGNQVDQIGFTIVSSKLVTRRHQYMYLVSVPDKNIRTLSTSTAAVHGLEHGTIIRHLGYRDLGGFSTAAITNNAYYTMNFRLFNPAMPWMLRDRRSDRPIVNRTMTGVPRRLDRIMSGKGRESDQVGIRFNKKYTHVDNSLGELSVEMWVVEDTGTTDGRKRLDHPSKLSAYTDSTQRLGRRRIAITRGGQLHASLTSSVFARKQLLQVARSVLVEVNTDELPFGAGASFFSSNRMELKTESQRVVEVAVSAAIDTYISELREIERERQAQAIRGRSASDEDQIRSRLNRIIAAFTQFTTQTGTTSTEPRGGTSDFRGVQVPTFLKFARRRPLQLRAGIPTSVELLTDAADEVMEHPSVRLELRQSNVIADINLLGGGEGRWRVSITAHANAAAGSTTELHAVLEREGIWRCEAEEKLRLDVVPPPPPFTGQYPASFLKFRTQDGTVTCYNPHATLTLETDASDRSYSRSDIEVISPSVVSISGVGEPSGGQIKLSLDMPADISDGTIGQIAVKLKSPGGAEVAATATLEKATRQVKSRPVGRTQRPNFEIVNVYRVPIDDADMSWAAMVDVPYIYTEWNGDDIGFFTIADVDPEGERKKIVFYLNAESIQMQTVEKSILSRRSTAAVDAFRQYIRTALCHHLYQVAINVLDGVVVANDDGKSIYENVRAEISRLIKTLIFAQTEFMDIYDVVDE